MNSCSYNLYLRLRLLTFFLLILALPAVLSTPAKAQQNAAGSHDPLAEILLRKGILTPDDMKQIDQAATPQQAEVLMARVLRDKGILSQADYEQIAGNAPAPAMPASASTPAAQTETAVQQAGALNSATAELRQPAVSPRSQSPAPPANKSLLEKPAPSVIAAVVPLRVLTLDPPESGGLIGVKSGALTFAPFGFIKGTAVEDSSSPNGDDFPIPAGLMLLPDSNTGPNAGPEFHMRARQSRIGINLEWPSKSKKLVLTGRIEADFEGNFNEADNADVTSIRNPNLRLRLAYARIDYRYSDKTSLLFVGGQDWTLFASKALPNLLDTTWIAASYGAIYNRSPQFRFGVVQKLGSSARNFKLSPEFAMMMPTSDQVEKLSFCTLADLFCNGGSPTSGLLNQIGEAERQGADSNRPELTAALTLQFRLDKAPAVAPAQIIWAGLDGRRTSIVTNSAVDLLGNPYPTALVAGTPFAKGYTASSTMYGNQVVAQLPTRWATLVVSGYRGADLRAVLGAQLTTNYTNTLGLAPVFYGTGVDNVAGTLSGFAMLACKGTYDAIAGTCSGSLEVAPEHGVRDYGGFAELGLPLSRWFNANPKGYNAGWQLYLHAGKDQLVHRDAAMQLGLADGAGPNQNGQGLGIPMIGSEFVGTTLYYKINQWCTFGYEQTHYGSRAIPELGKFWTIAATPSRIWQDQRSEFGPVFTF